MNKDDMIIKYTLMPLNEDDDYEHFFNLSLRELAKNTSDKSLLAPLILYNSDLDVPMDNDLEEYTIYCNEEQIIEVIRKQEINDVFRTLILHGFDISMDQLKNDFIKIARRNNANLCINVIQDTGIDSNITLYIDSDIENSDDKLWELQKQEMWDEVDEFIKNYDNYDYYDYSPEDIESVENFLEALFNDCGFNSSKDKKEKKEKQKVKESETKIIPLNDAALGTLFSNECENTEEPVNKEEIEEDIIAFSFEINNDIIKVACVDEELIVIEENDYEIALNLKQMDFIMECYKKILDYLDEKKPR
jgi:hypothetical protein